MRTRIILSAKDREARLKWAKKYRKKPKKFWQKAVHANIDNTWFPIYHNGKHRDYAARRSCRGSYRGPGQSLLEVYQKPKAGLLYNTGKKAACIMGGVGGGKVIMWEENSGTWDKHAAAAMYSCFTRSFRSTGLGVGAGGRDVAWYGEHNKPSPAGQCQLKARTFSPSCTMSYA
jgi:hypothetical protein